MLPNQVREIPRFPTMKVTLTYNVAERLSDVTARFPKINELLRKGILDAKLGTIKFQDFKTLKERLIVIDVLLTKVDGLDQTHRLELIQLVLDGDLQRVESILDRPHEPKPKPNPWSFSNIRSIFYEKDSSAGRDAHSAERSIVADRTSDVDFLSRLNVISTYDTLLQSAVAEARNLAQNHFDTIISKLLKKLVPSAHRIQQEEFMKLIQSEELPVDRGTRITRFRDRLHTSD